MKKHLLTILGGIILSSNMYAASNAQNKFNLLHGEEPTSSKVRTTVNEFQAWNDVYTLLEGSKHCKKTVDMTYLRFGNSDTFSMDGTNGASDYPDYMVHDITAEQFKKYKTDGETFVSQQEDHGKSTYNNTVYIDYTYDVHEFTNKKIDMNVKWGHNNYRMIVTKQPKNRIEISIDDNASTLNRIKGVFDWFRIRSRDCLYKKQNRDFTGTNRHVE
ncbi:hypothetical protein MJH12_05345 [bacterium]|nr:hypothetical protein [bacterium]